MAAVRKWHSLFAKQSYKPSSVDKWNRHDQKLFEAVEKGDAKKVASALSKRPIRATKNGPSGQSAFHLAAAKGLTECMSTIISHKVEINAKTDDGCTALHLAASNCHPECVKLLLQSGAHEDSIDFHSRTPLHCAATSGCVASVLLLCNAEDTILDAADDDGLTPLMIAAQRNHPTVCSLLLDRGAQMDLRDRDKRTALMLACEKGNIQAAETLLTKGADPGLKDAKGCDALSRAGLTRDEALNNLIRTALDRRKTGEGALQAASPNTSRDQELANIWKRRYEEEQKRGVWIQGELMIKTQEIERMAKEKREESGRIQELVDYLDGRPEDPHSKAGGPDADACSLLARALEHVRALKDQLAEKKLLDERIQALASRVTESEVKEEKLREEMRRLEGEASSAREREESARRRTSELEGHLENMREALSQFEKRKRIQSTVVEDLQEQISEVTREKEELLVLLEKLKGQEGNADTVQTKRLDRSPDKNSLKEFLKKLKSNCVYVEVRQNYDVSTRHWGYVPKEVLEKSAEDWKATVASVENYIAAMEMSQQQGVPLARTDFASVENYIAATEKSQQHGVPLARTDFASVENYIAATEKSQQHGVPLGRTDFDVVNGTRNEQENGHGSVRNSTEFFRPLETKAPRLQEDLKFAIKQSVTQLNSGPPSYGGDHTRSRDSLPPTVTALQTELSSLKNANSDLLAKMNQAVQEKQNLEEGLLALQESMQSEFAMRQETELRCKDYKHAIGALSDELQAEQEKLKKLNLRLEAQKSEMAALRDSFPAEVLREENDRTTEAAFSSDILEELYWNVGTLVRKYNEALRQAASLQKENQKLLDDQILTISMTEHKNIVNEMKNDLHAKIKEIEDLKQRLFQAMASAVELQDRMALQSVSREEAEKRAAELEGAVAALKEENEACKVALEGKCEEAIVLKQQLEQEAEEAQALRQRGVRAVREFEQVRDELEGRIGALTEEVRVLSGEYSRAQEEANCCKGLLASEREKAAALQRKIEALRKEAEDLKAQIQRYEENFSQLSEKHNQTSKASQEKDKKAEESMKELKSLTKEMEQLQRRCGDLTSQLEDSNKHHQETIAIYRTHLLNAAQGYMDEDVHLTLRWILKMQNEEIY
ncbi:ankyrin repeat domain-containing protein 35 [Gastrophryne carolinensis]